MTEGTEAFASAVDDDHEAGEWVGEPPAERRVEEQSHEHRAGKQTVDEGHASFGEEHRVVESTARAGSAGSEAEHGPAQ